MEGTGDNYHTVDLFALTPPVLQGEVITTHDVRRAAVVVGVPIFGTLQPGETDTLRVTWGHPAGDRPFTFLVQELTFSATDMPDEVIFGSDYPILYHPKLATMKVDLLRSAPDFLIPAGPRAGQLVDSWTYSFSVAQPAPEPASMVLLGSGAAAIFAARRRRRASN